MKRRIVGLLVAALIMPGMMNIAAAAEPLDSGLTAGVFKYNGTGPGTAAGKAVTMLQITPRAGGSQMAIAIPNNDPAGTRADPNTAAMNVIRDLKAGDLVKVRYNKLPAPGTLDKIEKATARPGDADPEAAEFIRLGSVKVADQEYQGVLYRKGGRELTALVPNKKADDGKMVPDGDMLAQAQKFAEFDYVDVETSLTGGSTFIKSVKPYEAPKSASFVKINAPESGANPPLSTVEVKADGKSVVLYVRPGAAGGASDPAMLAKIRAFRADQAILFKSAEESGKQWLSDIRADASTSTSSVTVAPAAGGVITLNGTFTRQNRPAQTPLKAVLTPSGANEWKVTFTFNYENQAYTYVGTITGNLRNGPVNCRADGSNRHYGFSGTANNGVLTFDCFESTDNYRTTIPKGVGTLR